MPFISFINRVWHPNIKTTGAKKLRNEIGDESILTERERDARILELLDNPKPTGETIEELAKLMGQTEKRKF